MGAPLQLGLSVCYYVCMSIAKSDYFSLCINLLILQFSIGHIVRNMCQKVNQCKSTKILMGFTFYKVKLLWLDRFSLLRDNVTLVIQDISILVPVCDPLKRRLYR